MRYEGGCIRMEGPFLAAVDIGGTKITASVAHRGGILAKVYQQVVLRGDNQTIPRQVDCLVDYVCDHIGIQKDQLHALGISTCGPFGTHGNYRVIVPPNLCGGLTKQPRGLPNDWNEIPLEAVLSQIYPRLTIDNDGITAAMAERLFGAGRGEDNLVYVTWSTGIGSGAYVDGYLIKGKHGNAPHIGHIYLTEDGPQCGCGNFGDMESLTSGVAIAREYGKGSTAEDAFLAYRKGNAKAVRIIEKAAMFFARGLASINAVLDTRVFVIGGSVFINNCDILLPIIQEEFCRSFPALSEGVEFRPSALDRYLGDIAALSLVMPDEWIYEWQQSKPWKHAPEQIVLDR